MGKSGGIGGGKTVIGIYCMKGILNFKKTGSLREEKVNKQKELIKVTRC